MNNKKLRIGIIGFGYIGSNVYKRLTSDSSFGLEIAFVYNRTLETLKGMPDKHIIENLDTFKTKSPNIIVEMAHPDISRAFGSEFLKYADYMPLSVTALCDPNVENSLIESAIENNKRLFLPHGALVGCNSLFEWRHQWKSVTIKFYKNPSNIDFSVSGLDPEKITEVTTVFDGTVREIGNLYPRNVNTMVTCALATTGLDNCRGILIADPNIDVAIAEVIAEGKDGSVIETRKVQPTVKSGVSGTEMFTSQFNSILSATNYRPGLNFV